MKVHSLLDSLGLSCIWSNQIHTIESFKRIVKQRLMDQFIQEWQSRVAENSVCSNCRLFKKEFCFEKYLTYLPSILRQRVLKFRLSNHRLPIQQRRSLGITRDEIICTVCDSGEVGDEFHYLPLNCSNENVKRNRTKYVDKYYTHHPNVPKFCSLMNMTSKYKNIKLAKFISCILILIKPITKHNGKRKKKRRRKKVNLYALALHIYNFDLCLSIYLFFIYKVW